MLTQAGSSLFRFLHRQSCNSGALTRYLSNFRIFRRTYVNAIYTDSSASDDIRRRFLYQGQLFTYSNRATVRALCDFAAEMIREAFGPRDPLLAQHSIPVESFVEIFAPLKPKFIHHPESKRLIQAILEDFGCDLDLTYQDVP